MPFTAHDGVDAVVVVSERLAPHEDAERYTLIVSLLTGALATAAAATIAAWVTTRALQPVSEMARTAADWSERDLSRRFAMGTPTNEITGLAATLDGLLDKVSAAIRSEQRLTSELAHELRTPLTALQGSAELALMQSDLTHSQRETLEEIDMAARRMASTITTLLEVARSEATVMDAASSSIADVVSTVLDTVPLEQLEQFEVDVEVDDQRIAAPARIAVRALAPVVENAVRFADRHISIRSVPSTSGDVVLLVEDDGPGVAGDTQDLFEPGKTYSGGSGAGLGLSIARRMARSAGGELTLVSAGAPTRFELRLPRA
ncbi:HAMP domain-containing sensor histidine kinase [Nocardioides bigeumensis]|uniref:sensor histidine kinase n=1 Tax=Nocardioides bigeumensis TaxID=433657 RepID=UPI0031D477FF